MVPHTSMFRQHGGYVTRVRERPKREGRAQRIRVGASLAQAGPAAWI